MCWGGTHAPSFSAAALRFPEALKSWDLGFLFHWGVGIPPEHSSFAEERREQRSLPDFVHLLTLKSVPVCTANKQGCKWKKKNTTNQKKKTHQKTKEAINIFFWLNLKICFSVFKWWCKEEVFLIFIF